MRTYEYTVTILKLHVFWAYCSLLSPPSIQTFNTNIILHVCLFLSQVLNSLSLFLLFWNVVCLPFIRQLHNFSYPALYNFFNSYLTRQLFLLPISLPTILTPSVYRSPSSGHFLSSQTSLHFSFFPFPSHSLSCFFFWLSNSLILSPPLSSSLTHSLLSHFTFFLLSLPYCHCLPSLSSPSLDFSPLPASSLPFPSLLQNELTTQHCQKYN